MKDIRFSVPFLVFLSGLAVTGGCITAGRNGMMPGLYGVFAVAILPLILIVIARITQRRWLWQLVALAIAATASFVTARSSARPPPAKIFEHIFHQTPPAGVTQLDGRCQWYDGKIWLLSFDVDPPTATVLIQSCGASPDPYLGDKRHRWEMWAAMAYDVSERHGPTPQAAFFQWRNPTAKGVMDALDLYWDSEAHRMWIVRLD